ncbi:hypothetical protein QBC37DRAFT_371602 [Rhypophila decipiens]|uniref:Uncharacterized protein n=1 Tax=Rhypophila decipiens TaxID=261697 RepID=A0AAN6YGT2_9PEZI|nr:hypothetical protein QBC37DRAFT_371602 [Rhypophila decipiens]
MDKGSNAQGTKSKSPPRFLSVVKIIVGGAATIVGLVTVLMIKIGTASPLEEGKYYYFTLGTAAVSAPLGVLTALVPRAYFLLLFVFGPMVLLWMIHFGVYAASYLNTDDHNIIGLGLMKAVLWVSVANAILWLILDVTNFIAWRKYSKKGKGGSTNEGTSEPLANYPIDLSTLAGGHNPGGYHTGPNTYYLPTSGQR